MAETYPDGQIICMGVEIEGIGQFKLQIAGRRPRPGKLFVHDTAFAKQLSRNKLKGFEMFVPTIPHSGTHRGFSVALEVPRDDRDYAFSEMIGKPYPFTDRGMDNLHKDIATIHPNVNHNKVNIRDKRCKPTTPLVFDLPAQQYAKKSTIFDDPQQHLYMNGTYSIIGRSIGGLQVTIGVAVNKLMNDDIKVREKVLNLLISSTSMDKKGMISDLISISIHLADILIELGLVLTGGGSRRDGVKLASLFYLIKIAANDIFIKKTIAGLPKDYFGINLKGYSSALGCGITNAGADLLAPLAAAIGAEQSLVNLADQMSALNTEIIDRLTTAITDESKAGMATLWNGLKSNFVIGDWGKPDQSIQVLYEEKPAIPNFFNYLRLFTVIECRQMQSPLGEKFKEMLEKKITAATFVSDVSLILH